MICDVHAHYIPQAFSDFMGNRFSPRVGVAARSGIAKHPVSDSAADIAGRLELMDAAGVATQILSPHRPPYLSDEAECVRALRLLNDGYAELGSRPMSCCRCHTSTLRCAKWSAGSSSSAASGST
jgi:hypothetical protein